MAVLSTALGILSGLKSLTALYDWCTGISTKDQMKAAILEFERTRAEVKRLSDLILYAPAVRQVSSVQRTSSRVSKEKEVKAMLDPLARALNSEILASAIVSVPPKLKKALKGDTRQVLADIRPLPEVVKAPFDNMVPVIFTENQTRYVGWQMPFILESMFGCRFASMIEKKEREYEILRLPARPFLSQTSADPAIFSSIFKRSGVEQILWPKNALGKSVLVLTNLNLIYTDPDQSYSFALPRTDLKGSKMFLYPRASDWYVEFELRDGKSHWVIFTTDEPYYKLKHALGFTVDIKRES
jgi:hypothetical protein